MPQRITSKIDAIKQLRQFASDTWGNNGSLKLAKEFIESVMEVQTVTLTGDQVRRILEITQSIEYAT